jgi:RNA polymerase sigma-70 factor, ECF subfamily
MDNPICPSDRHEQFVTQFVRHQAAVHSFVLSLLGDLSDTEDVVQEASLTMWQRFDQYQPGTNFRNWAMQIAKYTALNHLVKVRRQRRRFSEELLALLADRAIHRSDQLESQRRVLEHCIEKLSPTDQATLSDCYAENASIKTFAEETGRTANAIYKQLNRIRSMLSDCVRRTLSLEGLP